MNRAGIYIVLFLGISLYYSQIPPSHQFLLYYPVLGPVRILSSHWFWSLHFLTFGPPLICFSLIIYIYQTLGLTFFVLSRPGVQWFWFIIFTTVSSPRAAGRDGGIAAIYGGIVDGKCMLSLLFLLQTPDSISPPLASAVSSIIYHFLKHMSLGGGGCVRYWLHFCSWLWFLLLATWC